MAVERFEDGVPVEAYPNSPAFDSTSRWQHESISLPSLLQKKIEDTHMTSIFSRTWLPARTSHFHRAAMTRLPLCRRVATPTRGRRFPTRSSRTDNTPGSSPGEEVSTRDRTFIWKHCMPSSGFFSRVLRIQEEMFPPFFHSFPPQHSNDSITMAVVIPAYLPATGMRAFDCARSHLPYPTLPYRERSPLTRRDDPRPAEANTEHRATQKSTAEIDEKHGSHGRSEALELSAATEATRKGRGEMKFDGPLGSGADVAFEEAFPAYMDLLRGFERATGGDGEQLPQSAKANDDAWKQR